MTHLWNSTTAFDTSLEAFITLTYGYILAEIKCKADLLVKVTFKVIGQYGRCLCINVYMAMARQGQ